MKIAVLSDVHANLPALAAVLIDMPEVDEKWFAGDALGVLGWNDQVCSILKHEMDEAVHGNHDARERSDFSFIPEYESEVEEQGVVSEQLSDDSREWIESLPARVERDGVVMAHSNPFEEPYHGFPAIEVPYLDKRDWVAPGEDFDGVALMGHTHESGSLDRSKFDGRDGLFVNPGSVGVPWYKPAEYAIVDTETWEVDHRRVEYDYDRLESKFRELGLK